MTASAPQIGMDLPAWERVRMCVAEVGYPPEAIWPPTREDASFDVILGAMPLDVEWRAREVAGVSTPLCFACATEYDKACWRGDWPAQRAIKAACRAVRRLEQDCGVPR